MEKPLQKCNYYSFNSYEKVVVTNITDVFDLIDLQ